MSENTNSRRHRHDVRAMVREMAAQPSGATIGSVATATGLDRQRVKYMLQNMRGQGILVCGRPADGGRQNFVYRLSNEAPAARAVREMAHPKEATESRNHKARAQILALASRENGVHSSDLPEHTTTYFSGRCYELMNIGQLFRAKLAHKHTRYYTDRAAAERAQTDASRKLADKRPCVEIASRSVAFRPDAEVIFTTQTKFTRCPGYRSRFEAMTPSFVHTALQSGRVTG